MLVRVFFSLGIRKDVVNGMRAELSLSLRLDEGSLPEKRHDSSSFFDYSRHGLSFDMGPHVPTRAHVSVGASVI